MNCSILFRKIFRVLHSGKQDTLQQLNSQQTNYELSQKLVNIILQKFQLNQSTILDIKAAQSSFENAGYLLVNLQYAAKIAEIELKRLVYKLGK
jgi:outer membrane protein